MRSSNVDLTRALPFLFLALGFLAPDPASSFQPQEDPGGEAARLAVSLPILENSRLATFISSEPTRYELETATRGLAGQWEARWNRLTNTAHRLHGSGLALRPGGLANGAEVDQVSRAFVDEHPELAGVAARDLELVGIRHAARHWSAIYLQTHAGIPVEGARVDLVYTESGRLVLFGSDAYRVIDTPAIPVLGAEAALSAGSARLPAPKMAVAPELRILPVPSAVAGEEELKVIHHLAYKMTFETAEPLGRWVTWVDARSGTLLWRYDDIRYLEITGRVTADVEDPGYCDGATNMPLEDMRVNVSGVTSVFTNSNGDYSATVPNNSQRTVTATIQGLHVRVDNQGGPDASFSGMTTPGNPLNITWANAQPDERDVYEFTTRTYDFARTIDPTTPLGVLDGLLPANVSIPDVCNAFWNGSSINFFAEGGGCANTGRIGDVVAHEWGHGLSQNLYSPLLVPGDLGEGNSDVLAAHLTEIPIIGSGFNLGLCGVGIRDCNNNLRYPQDVAGQEIHAAGRVICGFDWHTRKNLEVLNPPIAHSHSDSLWYFTLAMFNPQDQAAQVEGYFILDDNDGNLANGTPHYGALCSGAERHGFPVPGPAAARPVNVSHSNLHTTTNTTSDYEVTATITSTGGPIDASETFLHYTLNGGSEVDVPMTPDVVPNEFHGFIPAQPSGTRVTYTITTRDVMGNPGAYPQQRCIPELPNGEVVFHVATSLDELEAESGWTVGAPGDNATTGIWTRVDPVGTSAQPEDDRTYDPGAMCFVTGQGMIGDGPGVADVDNGRTTLLSPVFDLTSFSSADLLYHRWYSNDQGATPLTDYWVVDVSNDGGVNWVNIENTNLPDASWREVRVSLNTVFGAPPNRLRVRYVAADLGAGSLIEAAVDEFMIFGNPVTSSVESPASPASLAPTRFALGQAVPNPFNPATSIRFELPERAALSLLVYDVRGRVVRVLADHASYEAGSHELLWDGLDDNRAPLPSGVYHVRMAGAGFVESQKVVMVK